MAIIGSTVVVIACIWMLAVIAFDGEGEPILFGQLAIPVWFWFSCPLFFNLVQLALSVSRHKQLRTPR
jgi:hypothetical protein